MKKIIQILLIFFTSNVFASDSIRFVDFNDLIQTSIAGKDLNKKIEKLTNDELLQFKNKKDKLVDKEKNLISKKNILENDIFQKELSSLRKEIDLFNKNRSNKINEIKKKQSIAKKKLIQEINLELSKYAEENSISLILNKQIIAVGKKELEITNMIKKKLDEKLKSIEIN